MPSVGMKTPLNQRRHDNISIVSMDRVGRHFEIACYRNKVLDWKSGAEKDLSNIIQVERVFVNVKKGEFAAKADLQKAFPGKGEIEIIQEILEKGTSQVNTIEREFHRDKMIKQIAHTAAEMSVDPWYHRLYTGRIIEKAMDQFGYSVKAAVPVKAQAVDVVRFLKGEGMPIERACMKFVIDFTTAEARADVKRWVHNHSHRLLPRITTAWCLRHRLEKELADKVASWVPVDNEAYELCWVLHEGQSTTGGCPVYTIGFVFPPHLYNRVEKLVKETGGTINGMDLRWAEREDICISELVIPKQRVKFKESSEEDDPEVELRQRRKEREEKKAQMKKREKQGRCKVRDAGDISDEDAKGEEAKKVNRRGGKKGKAGEELDEATIERLRQEAKEKAEAEEKARKKARKKGLKAPGQPKLITEPRKREKKKDEDDVPTPSDEEVKDLVLSKSERRKLRGGKKRESSSDSELFYSDRDSDYEEYLNFYEINNDYRHVAKSASPEKSGTASPPCGEDNKEGEGEGAASSEAGPTSDGACCSNAVDISDVAPLEQQDVSVASHEPQASIGEPAEQFQ